MRVWLNIGYNGGNKYMWPWLVCCGYIVDSKILGLRLDFCCGQAFVRCAFYQKWQVMGLSLGINLSKLPNMPLPNPTKVGDLCTG